MSEFNELLVLKRRMKQGSIPDYFKKRMKTVDSESSEADANSKNTPSVDDRSCSPKNVTTEFGTPLSELNTMQENALGAPDRSNHFLVDFNQLLDLQSSVVVPYPQTYKDKWDNGHVRMPCSAENLYPIDDEMGGRKIRSRWSMIKSILCKPILSPEDIQAAITSYNSRYADKWNFNGLNNFFSELKPSERKLILDDILPYMKQLALDLPNVCTQPPPLLKRGESRSITMSQKQIACLLANAFFCTFPRRNTQRKQSEYFNYPDINFIHLFNSTKRKTEKRRAEKLKCIFHYFFRLSRREPVGCVTFHRQSRNDFPDWSNSDKKLTKLHIGAHGTIEDEGTGMLQVDFANEFIGGGVLGQGCVQEEIRFVICPELIISRLFTEALGDNECLLITGCERFSQYKGYADDFVWDGDYVDKTPRDRWHRRLCQIAAVDATYFKQSKEQFQEKWLRREANKAYCGFYAPDSSKLCAAVATGNWGCGAFRGDPQLKFLLQLLAAAECGRDVAYFTFGNSKSCSEMFEMYTLLVSKDVTVGGLWNLILLYQELVKCKTSDKQLYSFLSEMLQAPANQSGFLNE